MRTGSTAKSKFDKKSLRLVETLHNHRVRLIQLRCKHVKAKLHTVFSSVGNVTETTINKFNDCPNGHNSHLLMTLTLIFTRRLCCHATTYESATSSSAIGSTKSNIKEIFICAHMVINSYTYYAPYSLTVYTYAVTVTRSNPHQIVDIIIIFHLQFVDSLNRCNKI